MQSLSVILMCLGLVLSWVLATETRPLFFWPGALLLGFAGAVAALRWRLRVMFAPSDACLLAASLLTVHVMVRAWLSPVPAWALEDMVIAASCWVVYLLVVTACSHPQRRAWLLVLLLAAAAGNLAAGFVHFSGRWDFHVVPDFVRAAGAGRIGGFFANPNHLGAFFAMALFLSAGWLCYGRGGALLKALAGFLIVAMAAGCALTLSRGALISLAAGGAVFAGLSLLMVWRARPQVFWPLLGGGLLAVMAAGVVFWKVNEEQMLTRELRSPVSGDVRLAVWKSALAQHEEAPWLGAGARMFYEGSIRLRAPELPVTAADPLFAHNEYLQMLADYGWAGLALALLMLAAHAWSGLSFLRWFIRHRYPVTGRLAGNSLGLAVGSLAALAATAAHAAVEFHFHVPATALTGALLLGILANPGLDDPKRAPVRLPGARFAAKALLAVFSFGLLACVWTQARGDYFLARAAVAQVRGDRAERLQMLARAAAASPGNPEVHYQRGLALLEKVDADKRDAAQADLEAAAAALAEAVALNPARYLHHLALADACDALGRHDEAFGHVRSALALAPVHEEPRLALGIHWHRLGDFARAERAYLWASEAGAWNDEETARWPDNYRLLLQHAALMRRQSP
ncbi:MAG TPA: hypothetical protein DIT13_12810 [Verrucomicrobiales bacterium]|nr:hypothetical protein [Verrucomicrobiales bacterium]HRJ07749.1 O-antigen ligase family protein [Prosthecobacter sp.]HRK13520.1 O-antigen ligase family protein [Prosthecobacter sp.]